MIKIVYWVLIRDEQETVFKELADTVLIPEAKKMPACQQFELFQNTGKPREFLFVEKWDRHEDVDTYKRNLIDVLGETHPGEEFPAKMNDLIESDEDLI